MLLLGGSQGQLSQVGTSCCTGGATAMLGGRRLRRCLSQHSTHWACLHSVVMSLKTKLDVCPESSSGAGTHSPVWEAGVVLVYLALEAFLRRPGGSVPRAPQLGTAEAGGAVLCRLRRNHPALL